MHLYLFFRRKLFYLLNYGTIINNWGGWCGNRMLFCRNHRLSPLLAGDEARPGSDPGTQDYKSSVFPTELSSQIIHCFTSVVQQTKRHSSRELLGGFLRRTTNFLKPVDDVLVHHRPPSLSRLYLAKSPSPRAKVRSAMHLCEGLLHKHVMSKMVGTLHKQG